MSTLLLTTKLYIPPGRPELVPRPRLIERLNAGALQLLTAIPIVRLVARLFRVQMLLSGQPLSAKRLLGALLGRA